MALKNDNSLATIVAHEIDRHARFYILRLLDLGSGHLSDQILLNLLAATGHHLTANRLDDLLDGLARQGLISTEKLEDVTLVALMQEGQEVATGRRVYEDIARPPLPRSPRNPKAG